jgi:predicted AlkP superfamily pyrophosphatase or phosphodiesterase
MANLFRSHALVLLAVSFFVLQVQANVAGAQTPSKPMSLTKFFKQPKLVVVLVIDQCRSDFLTRFHKRMAANGPSGGLRYLMSKGAYYPFAKFDILQSMTCPGHATVLTGAYPNQMGIPLNEWYDTSIKSEVYCAADDKSPIVGREAPPREGMSPRRLIGSTVGDELKIAGYKSKIVSVALKDRSSIMMGGHLGDLSIWIEDGRWVTSQYYAKDGKLPAWVAELNSGLANEEGKTFQVEIPGKASGLTSAANDKRSVKVLIDKKNAFITEYGVKVTTDAAIKALETMKLGKGDHPDILAVSYSSHDMLGHAKGLQASEMEHLTVYEDASIGELLKAIDKQVGLSNTVIAMTADHGVAPPVELVKNLGISAGTFGKAFAAEAEAHLVRKFGKSKQGDYILKIRSFNFYLNPDVMVEKKLAREALENELKQFIALPKANGETGREGVASVFTRTEYEAGKLPAGRFERQIKNTYVVGKSGEVVMIPKPFWVIEGAYATHITGYEYDRTVPLMLAGERIRPGVYANSAEVVDLAPTLSFILGLIPPSNSDGRVLHEILAP